MATVASTRGARRAIAPRRDLVLVAGLAISLSAFLTLVRKLVEAIAFDGGGRQLDASLQELASSRARIQAAADDERRRIERALHDGAQQRLVALRVRLALAADVIRDDPVYGPQMLQELGAAVEETLEVVRALAHDVYPQELIEFGLDAALNDLASREPVRVTVASDCMVRFAPEIEAAVYFCCIEAMRNAVDRGGGADRIAIVLTLEDSGLRFEVTDNGDGVSTYSRLSDTRFLAMRDRLAAVGGQLDPGAAPGGGTIVVGTVPLVERSAVLMKPEDGKHAIW